VEKSKLRDQFKAAIFDMDGLLIDSERVIMEACVAAAKNIGITYTQTDYLELTGRAWKDAKPIMIEQFNGEANFHRIMQGLDEALAKHGNAFPLKPGALDLLQHYQGQQIVCSVASSSAMHHITHRLSRVGVHDYFTHFTSGQEVERSKPNPDIYLLAVKKLGLTVADCIAFEDSEPGARAAIAAGLRVVVVPDLKQPSDFIVQNSHAVVGSLHDWLKHSLRDMNEPHQ
jgi:HAD superfamily hydrolase (TIGR01509 family)